MALLDNIKSVAKYESKLLMRSWFYRVFLILAVLFLCIFNFNAIINEGSSGFWLMKAIPENIPYINLLFLNTGQAIIAVFLSSEFLKTDKKLDTSEVFYVHPLSNAEYVIGKIWGNLDVFFRLNLYILAIVIVFNLSSGISLDWMAYISYFLLISIPTLIFIFGLSVSLMLILKNQAITFVILLGYIGVTVFYIKAKYYYLFDYMVYNLPLVKSTIVGYSNWAVLVNHRLIYLLLGLAFLCISIFLFRRLPNTKYGRYRWLVLSFCFFIGGGAAAYNHVNTILKESKTRTKYTVINNKYVHTPKMVIENYDIFIEQHSESISSEVMMKGVAMESSSVFTFCLNPGLQISEIKENDKELSFNRESQIILVDFGREITAGASVTFVMKYAGRIDEDFCYLDIPDEILHQEYANDFFKMDKRYSFQTKDYVLFTPETYWYPRPGTSYSSESPDWQQAYFSNFRLKVKTLNGLQALSQGTLLWPKERSIVPSPVKSKKKTETNSSDSLKTVSVGEEQAQRRFQEGNADQPQRRAQEGGQEQGRRRSQEGNADQPQRRVQEGNSDQPQRRAQEGNSDQPQRRSQEGGQEQGRRRSQEGNADQQQRRFQEGNSDQPQRRAQEGGGGEQGGRRRFQEGNSDQTQRRAQEGGGEEQGGRRRFQEGNADQPQRRPQEGDSGQNRQQFQRSSRDSIVQDSVSANKQNLAKQIKDSIFIFETDFSTPSLTLIIGDYEQKSVNVEGTEYSIWFIRGHNYFYPVFEEIMDTIPSMILDRKRSIETQYNLDYSYKRFSIVEVPVQFYSYSRTWSQAQEKMQPEMVLFPEKGCLFNNADFAGRFRNVKAQAKMNGQDLSDYNAAMRILNNFLFTFQRNESDFNFSSDRGSINITVIPNPYLIFPQLYNFRYNVFSSEWSISNRLIELYLQEKNDNDSWIRQMNGISNNEKANLLIKDHPLKELLSDMEQRNLLDNVVALKANRLFAPAERNIGYKEFRDSLRAVLQRNIFTNLRFENLLDTMSVISGEDLLSPLELWNYPTSLPVYIVGTPEVIRITNRDIEVYVVKLQIKNDSDIDGIVNFQINIGTGGFGGTGGGRGGGFQGGGGGFFPGGGMMVRGGSGGSSNLYDPRAMRKISLAAHETKQLVSVWDEAPRNIIINTLISANLPSVINMPISNIARERNIPIEVENDYIIKNTSNNIEGEVIVDNEDTHLFELSKPDIVGLLPKWLEDVGDDSFPYSGVSIWRPPLQWTLTTNDKYYGTHIRSAYVVKSGNGSQTATWKIPVPSAGLYDLYYFVTKQDDPRRRMGPQQQQQQQQNRGRRAGSENEYQFKVKYDEAVENAYINLVRTNEGWGLLGTYFFNEDTVKVTLSNDTKLKTVIADAVKIVKR